MKSALIPGKISLSCINSQSICARKLTKLDELRDILSVSDVDVISISETWLSDTICDSVLSVEGYQIIRHDRIGRLGGGIAIFIKKDMKFNILRVSENESGAINTEYIILEITIHGRKLLVCAFYNPPDVDCSALLDSLLGDYGVAYSHTYLMGDFNTNLLNNTSTKKRKFVSVLGAHGFCSVGSEPTFFHGNGQSQLDLILTNDQSNVLRFNQIDAPTFSNHDIIFACLIFSKCQSTDTFQYRNYNEINA